MAQTSSKSVNELNERGQFFLKTLIEHYIQCGQPIGSRTLAREGGMDLSPATIRNIMADLEDLGLITAPHTSAGRIPTVSGYRVFVDSLLTVQKLNDDVLMNMQSSMINFQERGELMGSVTRMLSGITSMAGLVSVPRSNRESYRQIEFLPMSNNRVLVILVTQDGEVRNRIITPEKPMSAAELEQAANFLNSQFAGQDIDAVRHTLLQDMIKTREHLDQLMIQAIDLARGALEIENRDEPLLVSGRTNLLDFDELGGKERLRQLFDTFSDQQTMLSLLDKCVQADGVQIFIGEESGYDELDHCSIITSTYQIDDGVVGVLGVVGPTRMNYDRVIPVVDMTAKLLSAALKYGD